METQHNNFTAMEEQFRSFFIICYIHKPATAVVHYYILSSFVHASQKSDLEVNNEESERS